MQIFCCKIEESKGLSYIHCSCGAIWKIAIQEIGHRYLAMYGDSTSGNLNTYSSLNYTHAINLGHWQICGTTWMYLYDSGLFLMGSCEATVQNLSFILHTSLPRTMSLLFERRRGVNLSWLKAEERMKKIGEKCQWILEYIPNFLVRMARDLWRCFQKRYLQNCFSTINICRCVSLIGQNIGPLFQAQLWGYFWAAWFIQWNPLLHPTFPK